MKPIGRMMKATPTRRRLRKRSSAVSRGSAPMARTRSRSAAVMTGEGRRDRGDATSPADPLAAVLVVLRRTFDRRDPGFPAFHPDLGLRCQSERCVVECSDPNLYETVAGVGGVEET